MEIKLIKNKNFIYKVQKNESLKDVCNKFKVLEKTLIEDNALSSCEIMQGDLLYIREENTYIHVVMPLETLSEIARKYSVSENYIIEKNNLKTKKIFIGQKLII